MRRRSCRGGARGGGTRWGHARRSAAALWSWPAPARVPRTQDAHEFLNYLLNQSAELLEAEAKAAPEGRRVADAAPGQPVTTWVHDIFQAGRAEGGPAAAVARAARAAAGRVMAGWPGAA